MPERRPRRGSARASRSIAITFLAPSISKARVRPPGPGPISITVPSSILPAARAIFCVRLRSNRKFWPSPRFGSMPFRRMTSRSGGRPSLASSSSVIAGCRYRRRGEGRSNSRAPWSPGARTPAGRRSRPRDLALGIAAVADHEDRHAAVAADGGGRFSDLLRDDHVADLRRHGVDRNRPRSLKSAGAASCESRSNSRNYAPAWWRRHPPVPGPPSPLPRMR